MTFKYITSILAVLLLCVNCQKETKTPSEKTLDIVTEKMELISPVSVEMRDLPMAEIPKNLDYEGKIQFAKTVTDKLGKHILLYCLTGEMPSKKSVTVEQERDSYLYIYDYIQNGNSYQLNWKIQDHIQNCMFDVGLGIVDKAITATDLDKDGHAEIWNMYHMTCTSDVSPEYMKIIMYEGDKKYALRGDELLVINIEDKEEKYGGTYTMDEAFKKSPKMFQDYAKEMWQNFRVLDRN